MSTTITGNPTAAGIAPDAGPQPEGVPLLTHPADGEAANVASILQEQTTLANHVAFLHKPRAKASDFEGPVKIFRSAAGHKRSIVDHLGLPAGLIGTFEFPWIGAGPSAAGSGGPTATPGSLWNYESLAGYILTQPSISNAGYSTLWLWPGVALNDRVVVYTNPIARLRTDNFVVFETLSNANPEPTLRKHSVGLFQTGTAPIHMELPDGFLGFRITAASPNWQCVSRAATVETVTDSGVAAVATAVYPQDRLRVEWHGETASDNNVRAARFYINGVLKATHTTNLPVNQNVGVGASDVRTTAGGPGPTTNFSEFGPVRVRWTLALDAAI